MLITANALQKYQNTQKVQKNAFLMEQYKTAC